MTNILLLTTSPRGEASQSTRIASTLVDSLVEAHPGARVVTRDLDRTPLPHIGESFVTAQGLAPEARSEEQRSAIALSDELIAELQGADIVVIASAMINFGITSTLKAWIDYVTRARVTFRYSETGVPEGLLHGKKVYLVNARGGLYADEPMRAINFQDAYLRHTLGFIGLTDLELIPVEGLLMGPETAEKALAEAAAQARSAGLRHAA